MQFDPHKEKYWVQNRERGLPLSSYLSQREVVVPHKPSGYTEWRDLAIMMGTSEGKEIERTFHDLLDKWREETSFVSSVEKMAMHPAYQQIIGMGKEIVPLILRELQQEPDHLYWALSAITRENPVRPEEAGDLDKMTVSWLRWGIERELI